MYKVFTDKGKLFKCNIDISGANIEDCQARILLETADNIFLYKGIVKEDGVCEVEIPRLKNIKEGLEGKISLEVIVENTLFNPWESDFIVSATKKVTVDIDDDDKRPITESKIDNKMKVSVHIDEEEEEVNNTKPENNKTLDKEQVNENIEEVEQEVEQEETEEILEDSLNTDSDFDINDEVFDFNSFFRKKNS